MTPEQLQQIMPFARKSNTVLYAPLLTAAALEFEINTPARLAAWIAQLAHESGELNYVRELASGEAYDTGSLAKALGNTPEDDDDGRRYKGRGLLQITGWANYEHAATALGIDCVANPPLLELPQNAARSAGWFWQSHGLNALADAGDFIRITRRINGGVNGLTQRSVYWREATEVFKG